MYRVAKLSAKALHTSPSWSMCPTIYEVPIVLGEQRVLSVIAHEGGTLTTLVGPAGVDRGYVRFFEKTGVAEFTELYLPNVTGSPALGVALRRQLSAPGCELTIASGDDVVRMDLTLQADLLLGGPLLARATQVAWSARDELLAIGSRKGKLRVVEYPLPEKHPVPIVVKGGQVRIEPSRPVAAKEIFATTLKKDVPVQSLQFKQDASGDSLYCLAGGLYRIKISRKEKEVELLHGLPRSDSPSSLSICPSKLNHCVVVFGQAEALIFDYRKEPERLPVGLPVSLVSALPFDSFALADAEGNVEIWMQRLGRLAALSASAPILAMKQWDDKLFLFTHQQSR